MIYIADKDTEIIYYRIDGWAVDAVSKALGWVNEHGYTLACDKPEITLLGDMIIWVRR